MKPEARAHGFQIALAAFKGSSVKVSTRSLHGRPCSTCVFSSAAPRFCGTYWELLACSICRLSGLLLNKECASAFL